MPALLTIDCGLTVTKAVVFALDGTQLAVARRTPPQSMPAPRHVERDMDALWTHTAAAIREVLAASGTAPADILAVAATAHGDGLYLLDADKRPLGPGILSLDSRAADLLALWDKTALPHDSLALTGQAPHVSAPSALLAWIAQQQPGRYARIAHILSCKDWLRFCLTGTIGTDRTEASTSFTDVRTQDYAPGALALFGLSALRQALPPISPPDAVVGTVTQEAAALTGLAPGTPVAAGLHDVTASALGIGAHRAGVVGIVAGTYSINEIVSDTPRTHPAWMCRNGVVPGRWNNMSISPASTTNYDWFLSTLCAAELAQGDIHASLAPEIAAALNRPSSLLYHPYLFGAPQGPMASAGFLGLRGWHSRGDMLAALLEGIVFNHRHHVDALRAAFPADAARLTGGASRNPVVAQLFADILALPVTVTATDEAAAWGAALCAGAAVGVFAAFDADPRDLDAISTLYLPDPGRAAHYEARFAIYNDAAARLEPTWRALEGLSHIPRGKAPQ